MSIEKQVFKSPLEDLIKSRPKNKPTSSSFGHRPQDIEKKKLAEEADEKKTDT